MKITTGSVSRYEDYKYVMQDTGTLYLGAKYSYEELLEAESVPFKLKAILNYHILKNAACDTTLESEFYYLEPGSFFYETWRQLKIRAKVQMLVEKKGLFGKKKMVYREKVLSLNELTGMNLARKKASGLVIQEIMLSKLAMMAFSV